ncbi:MAG: nucleotidyltransferase family protein [Sandaracinaceae bacterium]
MRTHVLLLAAGASRRFGPENKLLHPLDGVPMIRRAAASFAALPTTVVLGHDADAVRAALAGLDAQLITNPHPERGMGASIAAGMRLVDADAVLIALGDMPFVRPASVSALAAASAPIARPTFDGQPGHPVRFARVHHPALRALDGDGGARSLVRLHGFTPVPVDDPGVLRDVDTRPSRGSAIF